MCPFLVTRGTITVAYHMSTCHGCPSLRACKAARTSTVSSLAALLCLEGFGLSSRRRFLLRLLLLPRLCFDALDPDLLLWRLFLLRLRLSSDSSLLESLSSATTADLASSWRFCTLEAGILSWCNAPSYAAVSEV